MPDRTSPAWSRSVALTTTPAVVYLPVTWREVKVWVDGLAYAQLGTTYAAPAVADVSGVTTITVAGSPTGGTFKLKVLPNDTEVATTATIAYNDSAANVKTAITGTGKFASGDITAAGGAFPTDVTLTWTGVYAATVPPLVVGDNSLTGGSNPSVLIRVTVVPLGHGGYGYVEANTQETWANDSYGNPERYLYVATVAGTGTAHVTIYS